MLDKNKTKTLNTSINVLYIITKLELGGAQKVCLSLFKGVKKTGGFAGLISGNEGALVSHVKNLNSVYLLKNLKREIGFKYLIKDIKVFFELIKIIKKHKKRYSNLIIHTHSTKAGILGRWAAFFSGVKQRVHTIHGFGFHEYQNKFAWIFNYLMEFITSFITTHYICVSKNDVNIGNRLLPNFKNKNSIIRAAVEYDKFYIPAKNLNNFTDGKFILGTISCFKPQKNLIDLLKAYKKVIDELKLKSNEVLLQIIGDGVLRTEFESWILKNHLNNFVEFLGWQNDVVPWMKTWNLFVMSSLWEGLPCSVVEARLSRLPVIAYKISGIPEIIFDNKNGFLVEPGDWLSLAKNIKFLLLNKKNILRLSNYNDQLLNFREDFMMKNHINLYKELF